MKKTKFSIVALVLAIVMAMPTTMAFAQPTPDDMGLMPVREFFENLGATVEWQGEDRSIHIALNDGTLILFAGQTAAYANDVALTLPDGVSVWQGRSFMSAHDLTVLLAHFLSLPIMTFHLTEEARDIVLYDFDYMVSAILENSPWDSVLDRAVFNQNGLDFATHVDQFRSSIEAMESRPIIVFDEALFRTQVPLQDGDDARSIAANYLFAMLAFEFAPPLKGIGHLGVETLDMYTSMLSGLLIQYHDETLDSESNLPLQMFIEAFTHPSAIWLYGEVEVDLTADVFDTLPNVPGNIVAEILVPDEVAFLRINSFLANPVYDDSVILPFLQEVQDFDHLIIDVRNNLGGLAVYFEEFILRRLISEPVEIGNREFFSGGDLAFEMMDATLQTILHMGSVFDWSEIISTEIIAIDDFLAENDMPYFNTSDLARLENVMLSRWEISPAYDSIHFDGKVWLLVNDMSASASAMVAEIALDTGFATVVGENTSGVMGSSAIFITLPNTGIIWRIDVGYRTDSLGRSLEAYGIEPQIRNFAGMNALETVLELIAEGNY